MPNARRGEIWLVDLGMTAKVRPAVIFSIPFRDDERALYSIVPHTTALRGGRFEVKLHVPWLENGAFDVQGLRPIPNAVLVRRLGALPELQMDTILRAIKVWLQCSKIKNDITPTSEQKRRILHDAVFYEILFTHGVSPHDETDYCSWEHINFSRMGHARVLYDFFETPVPDRRQDDVVSEDYEFGPIVIDRQEEDRKRLNKDLFHLTYERLRHFANPEKKFWPNSILSAIHKPCVDFIEHLLARRNEFGKENDFSKWEQLLKALKSGRELKIVGHVQTGLEYSIILGRPLPAGRSELTILHPKQT